MNQGVSRDLRPRPRNVAKREKEKAARRRAHEEATYDDIYRTLPEITQGAHDRADRGAERAAPARPARGEPALLPGEERAQARGLAARAAAHRAPAVAVFLSAAPDQDDERGLRHLRALRDHEPAVRARPAHRRHHARVPALALVGDLPARLQRSPLQRPQSVCARLRHDERHPAHRAPSRPPRTASGSPRSPAAATGWAPCARPGRTTATRASCCST